MIRLQLLGGVQLSASDGRDLRPLLGRPKRLALLAYLAAREPGNWTRRDALTGLLWPEMDQAGARKAVRQALYVLRGDLGEEVFESAGDDDVRVSPEHCWCDVAAFRAALKDGRREEALELYRGDLMPAFFVPEGGAEFERWMEEERGQLRALASRAAWELAESAERNRKSGPATSWGRQALALSHDDETALRRLIQLLDRMGDRAGALRAYETFARRLKDEFGDEPAVETRELIRRLRERGVGSSASETAPALPPAAVSPSLAPPAAPTAATRPAPPTAPAPRRAGRIAGLAAALVVLAVAGALWWRQQRTAGELSTLTRATTWSTDARAHYRRGLEAWYVRQDAAEAQTELKAALAADSTFAMAAYWLANVIDWTDAPAANRYLAQAIRMAPHATPDEQRLIDLYHSLATNDPRAEALADLLVAQYPRDLDILSKAAQTALASGHLPRAAELAREVLGRDTTPTRGITGPCPQCDAYYTLIHVLVIQDSLAEVEATVRRWRAARPDDIQADRMMSMVLDLTGRYEEARTLAHQMADRHQGNVDLPYQATWEALRIGDAESVRVALTRQLHVAPDSGQQHLAWLLVGVLRNTGRADAARQLLELRVRADSAFYSGLLAQVAWEQGDFATAARLVRPFLTLDVTATDPSTPRAIAWWLARGTTYLASAGDTAALGQVADRLEQVGRLSLFGRDRRAFHYPRARLAMARGQFAEAEAELRAAILAPSDGYTRINLELGQLLLRQHRPAEALAIVRPLLSTDMLNSSTLYVTQPELHQAMAQAFAQLGQDDSTRAYYQWLVRAWRTAEPRVLPQRREAERWLAEHPARSH